MKDRKNEKIPLTIAIVCGAVAVFLFMVKATAAGSMLGVVAGVAFLMFAEGKWHNLKQEEIDRLNEALRQCQIEAGGGAEEGRAEKEG